MAPPPANAVINVDRTMCRRRMNHWFTAAISVCPNPADLPIDTNPGEQHQQHPVGIGPRHQYHADTHDDAAHKYHRSRADTVHQPTDGRAGDAALCPGQAEHQPHLRLVQPDGLLNRREKAWKSLGNGTVAEHSQDAGGGDNPPPVKDAGLPPPVVIRTVVSGVIIDVLHRQLF